MEALSPADFLKQLSDHREAFWEKMSAERKSYGAEKPLTPEIILRRLQFGVVMERKAAEVSAPLGIPTTRVGTATLSVGIRSQ